jgi:hypothetical protein
MDEMQLVRELDDRALSDVEPRPDQFVYTKSAMGTDSYESWMSVDGTRTA